MLRLSIFCDGNSHAKDANWCAAVDSAACWAMSRISAMRMLRRELQAALDKLDHKIEEAEFRALPSACADMAENAAEIKTSLAEDKEGFEP